ncbi:MAG TPA: nascent polypeptide-associated complex protein [Candidatus Nanoarchaeia archaeon]|nr:nascent polypeptide-associated complex protein [Candidatus Nanoarchaeia archaeon]
MIPKLNSRELAKAMQRMGIQQQDIEATEVIIRCQDKDIVITNPQVAKVNMMGQETWQITGTPTEQKRTTEPDIKEEDIQTVMQQTGKSHDEALKAINEAKGDLAQAILNLSQ